LGREKETKAGREEGKERIGAEGKERRRKRER
jgi:hypothetical protein